MLQPHLAALETIQPLWLGRFLFLLFSVVLTALIFPAGAGRRVSRGICHTKCPHKCDGKIKWPFLKSLLCTEFSAFTQHNLIDQIMPEQHTTPEVQALRSKKDWFFTQAHAPVSFPGGAVVKNPPANAGDTRDVGSIPGSGRSPRVGNGNSAPVFLPEKFHGLRGHRVPYDWTHAPAHTHTHTRLVQIGGGSAPHCPLEMDPAEAAPLMTVVPAIRHAQAGSTSTERLQAMSEFLIISASKEHFASTHRSLAIRATWVEMEGQMEHSYLCSSSSI